LSRGENVSRRARQLIIGLFVFASVATGFGAPLTFESLEFPSARTEALGGMHAALADDISTLFSNPAGFRSADPQFSVTELSANLTGPLFSIADLVMKMSGGADPLSMIADANVQKLLTSLYASALLNGPLAFGYVGDGLGFGFFNSSGLTLNTQGTVPTMYASVNEDLLFVGGYAFRIPLPQAMRSTLDLGISIKAFAEGSVEMSESILDFLSLFSSPILDILQAQPFTMDVGFGVDTGILYSWNKTFSFGIVGRDLYAPVVRNAYASFTAFSTGSAAAMTYGTVPCDLSAGILFSPGLGSWESYISHFKVLLDYKDIIDFLTHPDTATNPVLHVGIGVECVLLDILALRGGFNEGYFSAGLGMDLTAFRLNLSMYGTELSTEPGMRPAYNLLVSIEFTY